MASIPPISGFPEWSPQQKIAEDAVIDRIRTVYEAYGFSPIETAAVEHKSTLSEKGVIDKEIYVLKRALADPEAGDEKEELALHFDLTVPFARYTAQRLSSLTFPFKRYQLQKVWRGDRPQKGRFREFYQFDIDIIARETLPISADAEVLDALNAALCAIAPLRHRIRYNNRKLLQGAYEALGLSEDAYPTIIRIVDKLDKIETSGVERELTQLGSLDSNQIRVIMALMQVRGSIETLSQVETLLGASGGESTLLQDGISEIRRVYELVSESTRSALELDMSLARGLDYYTGTICEVVLPADLTGGSTFSVGGGGRYDNLAGQFTNQKLPGVGVSIGLTRLMDLMFRENLIEHTRSSLIDVLFAVYAEEDRAVVNQRASEARALGLNAEVYLASPKLGKQIEYAEAKGARWVVFVSEGGNKIEAKDIAKREQQSVADWQAWCKQASDLKNA